jgi:hypothetical protein
MELWSTEGRGIAHAADPGTGARARHDAEGRERVQRAVSRRTTDIHRHALVRAPRPGPRVARVSSILPALPRPARADVEDRHPFRPVDSRTPRRRAARSGEPSPASAHMAPSRPRDACPLARPGATPVRRPGLRRSGTRGCRGAGHVGRDDWHPPRVSSAPLQD